MRSEFRGDFNKVSVGDIIELDSTVYQYRKEGQILHIAQQGNQNDRSEFQRQLFEEGFGGDISLMARKLVITHFYPQEDMQDNRDLRDEGRDAEYGQFITEEVCLESGGYQFKNDGVTIAFNQGAHDARGGFDSFEQTFNFPKPRLGTVQFEIVKKIVGFIPA